jgi:hypothetical protein
VRIRVPTLNPTTVSLNEIASELRESDSRSSIEVEVDERDSTHSFSVDLSLLDLYGQVIQHAIGRYDASTPIFVAAAGKKVRISIKSQILTSTAITARPNPRRERDLYLHCASMIAQAHGGSLSVQSAPNGEAMIQAEFASYENRIG